MTLALHSVVLTILHAQYYSNYDLYSSADIIRVIISRGIWARPGTTMVGQERCFRVLVGKPAGKRPLGKPRHRWYDNITMDLQEVG